MPLNISYVFTAGTVIEPSEMNSNFTGVKNFVDALATGANIDSGAITAAKIATGAVETAKIADSSVTAAKIADETITAAKIADGTITAAKLGSGIISSPDDDQFVIGGQVFG
jgi:hypothetical protein